MISSQDKTPEEKLDDIIKENDEEICYANIKYLYAEPIPKAYRSVSKTFANDLNDIIHDKLEDKTNKDIINGNDNIDSCIKEKPKLTKSKAIDLDIQTNLTDTLRSALKRPLPSGPAPKKPPRTFLHSPKPESPEIDDPLQKSINHLKLDESFTNDLNASLHKSLKDTRKSKNKTKSDPMYILNKLENALKNNKIRLKKQQQQPKLENTSGDESDYDLKTDQQLLSNCTSSNNVFNLNCLSALTCTNTIYEKIKEPNSSFFVKTNKEEPVYAIPFQSPNEMMESTDSGNSQDSDNGTIKRNSLYYMVSK